MGMMQEFKEFAVKGNFVDMVVGIVIGAAFTSIVNSFVKDIINPIIGVITGGIHFSNLLVNLGDGTGSVSLHTGTGPLCFSPCVMAADCGKIRHRDLTE